MRLEPAVALRWFKALALLTAILGYIAIVLGGWVTSYRAGDACGAEWPTCNGAWLPTSGDPLEVLEWSHRIGAGATGFAMWGLMILAWIALRKDRGLLLTTTVSFFTLGAQVFVGYVRVMLFPGVDVRFIVGLHLALATAFFAFIVITAILAFRRRPRVTPPDSTPAPLPEPNPEPRTAAQTALDYAMLLKPGILVLLVLTGITAMVVAGGTAVTPLVFTATVIGGALSGGAASALNHYLERDIDTAMARTRSRPLPSGHVPAQHALTFALVLATVAFLLLWVAVNFLSAALALGGLAFYALIYTTWLKPSTPQNIVIGGAAGAFPALVGWSAVSGSITLPALLLGALVFLWTPPHFWALAVLYREDYRHASIPMLPVVHGVRTTKRQMLFYTAALVAASVLFVPLGVLGGLYLLAAVILGGAFVVLVAVALRTERAAAMRRVFTFSIYYLLALFVAMMADKLL